MNIKKIFTYTLPLLGNLSYAQSDRPNIIWLMAEDMGQDLGCYGMAGVKTPVLDKMANEGIQYMNAYCSSPISSPSRSSMMTGVHQVTINAHNHRSNRNVTLKDGINPITYYLRKAGYTCILGNSEVFGKGTKIDCNFKCSAIGEWNGVDKFGLFDKKETFTAADQPFFAQIQLKVTHRGDWWKRVTSESTHPVNPDSVVLPPFMPDHPKVRQEWASYLDQIEYMDNEVQLIIDQLKTEGILDNTIIIFIADNGRCDIRGKGYLYEPGIRIPMIIWGKGIENAKVNDLVSTLDISASILNWANAELPDYLSGKPLQLNGMPQMNMNKYFYSARDNWDEIVDCIRSISTEKYSYIRNYMPEYGWDRHQHYLDFHRPAIHIMRSLKKDGNLSKEASLFMADKKPEEELYDIENDPFQLVNLASDPAYSSIKEELSSQMDLWQKKHFDDGLADLSERRKTPILKNQLLKTREWLQNNNPSEWQKIVEGEIVDKYQEWTKKANSSGNKNKKKNKKK